MTRTVWSSGRLPLIVAAGLGASVALTGCFGETVSNALNDCVNLCELTGTSTADCQRACEEAEENTGGRDTGNGGGSDAASDAGGNPQLDVPVSEDSGSTDTGSSTDTGGGGGSGTDCVGIIECINGSGGTQADLEACIAEGNPTAQDEIIAVLTCLQTNCADAATEAEFATCQAEFCSAELTECTGSEGPPDPSGTETCSGVVSCFLTCRDQACATDCLGDADSVETQEAAINYYNCGVENCASATSEAEFATCVEESCPDEAAACL